MILAEPPQTQFDLQFRLAGIPVRVHPFFWLAGLVLGARLQDGPMLLIWIAVMFVSIMVHELGHAFAMRYYGESARIVLYMFGGLAIADSSSAWSGVTHRQRDTMSQVVISAAGPAAGFFLAVFVMATVQAAGGSVSFELHFPFFWTFELPAGVSRYADAAVFFLLAVNILWGMLNLLPVQPLDGGQIAREILVYQDPAGGLLRSLWLSVIAGAGIAVWGLLLAGDLFIAILFGLLAYSSYTTIQQYLGRGGFGGGKPW